MLIFPKGVCFFEMGYLKFQLSSWGCSSIGSVFLTRKSPRVLSSAVCETGHGGAQL